jgi:hypothetical protein
MARDFANTAGSPNIDYIVYSGVPPVAGLGTVSVAIRLAGDSDCPNYGTIIDVTGAGGASGIFLGRNGGGSSLYAAFRNGSAAPIQTFPFTFDGTFRSVVVTWDGSATPKTVAYVDGVAQTVTGAAGAHTTIGTVTAFRISSPAGIRWNGRIADLGIYNRVLTADEAAMHADGAACTQFPRGLICHVNAIRDVHDIAGGLTGTITGTTVAAHPRIYL